LKRKKSKVKRIRGSIEEELELLDEWKLMTSMSARQVYIQNQTSKTKMQKENKILKHC
jgi:hypothetical protein